MSSSILTTEFLISAEIPDRWLDDLKKVWNEAIFYLNWLQHYNRVKKFECFDLPPIEIKIKKIGDDWVGYCDRTRDFRIDKTKSWDAANIEARDCCTLVNSKWLTPPPIGNYSSIELKKPFAKKRCEWLKDSPTPTAYINDFIELVVSAAWEAYQKGTRDKPKYKRENDKITTLVSASFRGQAELKPNDVLKVPGLQFVVPKLEARLLEPIARMIDGMRSHPEKYPRLTAKIQKITNEQINKLIKSDGKIKKELSEEEIKFYSDRISRAEIFEIAIAYFSKPGSFRIVKRENKTYLQITAEMPVAISETDKTVGIDTGLDLLVHSTSNLRVKHQNFTRELTRIDILNSKLAKMKYGSSNYKKLLEKIRKIQGKIKRSKRGYQGYWAQQIADVNGFVSVKEIKPKEAIEVPLAIASKSGKYIKNGRTQAKIKNQELHNCATGQFVVLLKQACNKKGRVFSKITIEPEAVPEEILEVADFPPVIAASELAQNPSGAREGERETASATSGKGKPTASKKKKKPVKPIFSVANPPVSNGKPRRKRKKEKAIG